MNINARLNRLMPVLSAKERAILILQAWRDGTKEDSTWRSTMPPGQVLEFNRLIELMNGSMINMSNYIMVMDLLIHQVELRQAWMVTLLLWEEQTDEIGRAVRLGLREPISQSDYDQKQRELNETWIEVDELASVLAGEHEWEQDDRGPDGDVTDEAWERVCSAKERELRRAVAAGVLPGRGRGGSLRIQEGAFNEWSGRTTCPVPDHVLSFDLRPDSEGATTTRDLTSREWLYRSLEWTSETEDEPVPLRHRLLEGLKAGIAVGYADCRAALDAVELVTAEATEMFEGSIPLRQGKPEQIDQLRKRLDLIARELAFLEVEVPEPERDEELIEKLRHMTALSD